MRLKTLSLIVCLLVSGLVAFGQTGNGIITGVVTDQAGAVVPGASVQAKNQDTGVVFTAATSNAGNYTIADLPVGVYAVTVTVKGFKTYTHTNITVAAATTLAEDVALQVGAATESVTVTAEATLLKTETGDLATNVTITQIDELPIMGTGNTNSGTSGFRNWYNIMDTIPGVSSYNPANSYGLTVNGLGQQAMLVEGQEASDRILGAGLQFFQMGQMGVDAIQEMAVQSSNYAPEFGTASSVVINTTMKSGTNTYHGSGFDYFVNEDLNAGDPFSTTGCIYGITAATASARACDSGGGSGGKFRPRNRSNDFGGTLGGPVIIPKIYNGRNRTFWFFSYEQFLQATFYTFSPTAPVPAYLNGDFSAISPNGGPGGCSLCTQYGIQQTALGTPTAQKDALGNLMYANEIYDPASRGVNPSNNLGYAQPFMNNMIPATRFDPLYVKTQALITSLGVKAQNGSLTNNYNGNISGNRYSAIPSIKIDHNLSAKDKLSFLYTENNTQSFVSSPLGAADGLPLEIGTYIRTQLPSYTERLNYDRTLAPTLLLHLGGGYIHTVLNNLPVYQGFNPSTLGLTGFLASGPFPSFAGQCSGLYGGMGGPIALGACGAIGTAGGTNEPEEKPTYVANLTWVKGKHTYKIGGSLVELAIVPQVPPTVSFNVGTGASAGCASPATCQPFVPSQSFNSFTTGFGYASWMLGDYTASTQTPYTDPRNSSSDWAVYIQDSWKVTRKLTLDYGLRWDLFGVQKEQYGRLGQFSETVDNANAGGHPGGTIYASNCGCSFYQPAYPFAIGPRLGVAYQINSKTVFRGGWGVTYALTQNAAGQTVSTNGSYVLTPGINSFVNEQTSGFIQQPAWPVTNPSQYPAVAGTIGTAPTWPDQQENRPPRVSQWSAGFQREITRSFVMEAEYVGNTAAWLSGFLGGGTINHIPPSAYAAFGLYPYPGTGPAGYNFAPAGLSCQAGNDCARAILSQPLSSTAVQQTLAAAGITNYIPYSGYPLSTSLQSIIDAPFPQFGRPGPGVNSPTGNSSYDSLQVKATKRVSHGLQASGFFTWAQGFTRAVRQDYFNPASTQNTLMAIPPRTLNFSFIYTTPKAPYFVDHAKFVNTIIRGWELSFFGNYQSAGFLTIPATPNSEFLGTQDIYNKGVPLYLNPKTGQPTNNSPLNGNFNPWTDLLLNPAAWTPCPVSTNCGNSGNDFLKGFRGRRHPSENANIGRNFRIKERMNLQVRGEFVNIFNRDLEIGSPSTAAPQNAVTRNSLGILTGGFGVNNAYNLPGTAGAVGRTGTVIARFSF
jgi:Carboxypeptidase regulatory-like domain/TonB dependent receptor